jgi:hypothetical protein
MTGRIDARKEFAMLDGLTPDLAPRLVLAIGGVGIALVVLVLVLIFLKRRNSPLFIKGGKAREARLVVLDAAAIDPKRRLVLIRRDEVEHLIMIGGPTDIVIETGITDRTRAATPPERSAAQADIAAPRAAAVPQPESRPTPAVAERRPEPVRPVVAPVPPEKPVVPPIDARASVPLAQHVVRPAAPLVDVPERVAPSIDRYMERPAAERLPEAGKVSAMGSVLYGEDREPMTGARSMTVSADTPANPPVAIKRAEPEIQPVRSPLQPLPSTAEAVLDAARDRVLPSPQPAAATPAVTVTDAERALAARMEAMRRVQSAQPAATPVAPAVTQGVVQPVAQRMEPRVETPKPKDAEPSDFEKLLEAELDASGVFGKPTPELRSDPRVTAAVAANAAVPPVRVSPPITGATPDITSEEEVARLLGEIAVNRKP